VEIARDGYSVTSLDPEESVLELEWLEASARMTEEEFKGSMERLAAHAEEHRPGAILVDVRSFRFAPGPDFGAWSSRSSMLG